MERFIIVASILLSLALLPVVFAQEGIWEDSLPLDDPISQDDLDLYLPLTGGQLDTPGDLEILGQLDLGSFATLDGTATPDVSGGNLFVGPTVQPTITDFTPGDTNGRLIAIVSGSGGIDYDCTSTELTCGTTLLNTDLADTTVWLFHSTFKWILLDSIDISKNQNLQISGPVPDCGPAADLQGGDGTCISTLTDLETAVGGTDIVDSTELTTQLGYYLLLTGGTLDGPGDLEIEGVLDIGTTDPLGGKGLPDVSGGSLFETTGSLNYSSINGGTEDGHTIRIRSETGVTFECGIPSAGNIECGTTDLVTDAGDITEWEFDGTTWTLIGYTNDDEDYESTKAEVVAANVPALVTYENLNANGDIGFGPSQVPEGTLAAPLDGPGLTGDPTRAVDPLELDSDQSIPTTNWVDTYFGRLAGTQTWIGNNLFEDLTVGDGLGNDADIYNNSVGFYIRPDAQDSIYIGYDNTLASIPTGADNVVVGGRAGSSLTSSNHNTLVGAYAGAALTTTGTRNTFIGRNAGGGVTGFQNTAVGWGALSGSGAINYSTAVGYNAGASLTTGTNNLFFGYTSGPLLTQGSYNLIMGGGNALTTGSYNIVLGDQALFSVSTNSDNIGIGYRSNRFQTGSRNIAIGSYAGAGINGSSTGSGNVLIGDWAGNGLTTGAGRNIFIGEDAGRYQTTAADTLIIDNRDQGSAANELVNSLVVGTFNATRTSQRLRVNGALSGMKRVVVSTGNYTVPYEEMLGTFHVADHTTPTSDVDYTLPTAEVGLNACFYDNGGGDGGIIIDAAAGDEILLNGIGVGVADAIDSPGVAGAGANGDYICIQAIDAT